MRQFLVVATPGELDLPWADCMKSTHEIIVTGVGGANVIRALKDLPRDSEIFNVGYCGSAHYPIGSTVWIRDCRLWHPNVNYTEPTFSLKDYGNVICLTAGDFVLDGTELPAHSVVDMELAYIAAFGFAKVSSVKFVSDNFSLMQYENTLRNGTK